MYGIIFGVVAKHVVVQWVLVILAHCSLCKIYSSGVSYGTSNLQWNKMRNTISNILNEYYRYFLLNIAHHTLGYSIICLITVTGNSAFDNSVCVKVQR